MTAPIQTLNTSVPKEWIDYNDHMSEGYYGVAFGDASDTMLEHIGFGEAYRNNANGSFYTVETRISYELELPLGESIKVHTTVIGVDAKRLHLWHELANSAGQRAATQESLLLHVDQTSGRVSPMRADLLSAAKTVRDAHAKMSVHTQIGQSIRPVPKP